MLDRLGDYVIEGELGRGGMGTVYRARHVPTGAIRALKVLAGAPDPEAVARFRREAEALARVGDGVVPVHEVVFGGGRLGIALGLMPGGSLGQRVEARGPLDWREAVGMAIAIARVLERCHALGLVHRDLKPENVLLDDEGRPRLADFGIVRDLGAATLTETGTMLGTPIYMPPEQLEGKRVDGRADVYALGCVLHEMIAGKPPFEARSPYELLRAKTGARPRLPAGVPSKLDGLIGRALAADPGSRPESASRLRQDLEAILAPGVVKPERRGLALPVLALVVAAAWLASRPSSPGRSAVAPVPVGTGRNDAPRSDEADLALVEHFLRSLDEPDAVARVHSASEALARAKASAPERLEKVCYAVARDRWPDARHGWIDEVEWVDAEKNRRSYELVKGLDGIPVLQAVLLADDFTQHWMATHRKPDDATWRGRAETYERLSAPAARFDSDLGAAVERRAAEARLNSRNGAPAVLESLSRACEASAAAITSRIEDPNEDSLRRLKRDLLLKASDAQRRLAIFEEAPAPGAPSPRQRDVELLREAMKLPVDDWDHRFLASVHFRLASQERREGRADRSSHVEAIRSRLERAGPEFRAVIEAGLAGLDDAGIVPALEALGKLSPTPDQQAFVASLAIRAGRRDEARAAVEWLEANHPNRHELLVCGFTMMELRKQLDELAR